MQGGQNMELNVPASHSHCLSLFEVPTNIILKHLVVITDKQLPKRVYAVTIYAIYQPQPCKLGNPMFISYVVA